MQRKCKLLANNCSRLKRTDDHFMEKKLIPHWSVGNWRSCLEKRTMWRITKAVTCREVQIISIFSFFHYWGNLYLSLVNFTMASMSGKKEFGQTYKISNSIIFKTFRKIQASNVRNSEIIDWPDSFKQSFWKKTSILPRKSPAVRKWNECRKFELHISRKRTHRLRQNSSQLSGSFNSANV